MNKRIKKKHESIVNRAIGLENKQLMNGVLNKLRSHGLTPHKIEFPAGYFLFMNKTPYEIMHFEWNSTIFYCICLKKLVKALSKMKFNLLKMELILFILFCFFLQYLYLFSVLFSFWDSLQILTTFWTWKKQWGDSLLGRYCLQDF